MIDWYRREVWGEKTGGGVASGEHSNRILFFLFLCFFLVSFLYFSLNGKLASDTPAGRDPPNAYAYMG
jgi:hypothetical protein